MCGPLVCREWPDLLELRSRVEGSSVICEDIAGGSTLVSFWGVVSGNVVESVECVMVLLLICVVVVDVTGVVSV